ncbi:hypothetical protein DH2020_048743 [Rehmannia glutinosa]|uniref:protein-serine/threonine phosphatase n=1 Tax=Rehmannia glutinosa TaxID=99300 RepID=A0ABR0U4T3_REHGL
MCSSLGRTVSSCLRPLSRYARMKDDYEGLGGEDDALLWSRDLEKHYHGEFSFAVVQANEIIEDHSQVETGRHATFVGVYDGHGLARENGKISKDVIRNALSETENGFLTLVRELTKLNQQLQQLVRVVCLEEVRKELKALHPEDSQIVVMKQGVWRIKGIIQVSRSIGDAYLKMPEFALDPSFPRFHLPEPLRRPVLRSDPAMFTRDLQQKDKFVIFASDGLWEHLTNQEAVEIVHSNPRTGIARRLVITALEKAAMTRQIPYNEVKKLDQGIRRHVHDDITVVVVFIDHEMLDNISTGPELSVRGFVDTVGPSNFNF